MARILEVVVGMARGCERIDGAFFQQQRFAGLERCERLAAQEHAGAQGAIEEESERVVGGGFADWCRPERTLGPRKRSQSETSGQDLQRVSASWMKHGKGFRRDRPAF